MQKVIVDIAISADEYLKYYVNPKAVVNVRSRDGRRVQFPANILQPHVGHEGIRGSFQITFNQQGRFQGLSLL